MLNRRVLTCAALLYAVLCASASAQEVQWRSDYPSARREAIEKSRPLVLDVGTENCFYCKKLDATTFRDPGLVGVMNERFIPLKIDADRDPALAEALRVMRYPTIVIAGADGKIFNIMEGYMEAPRFQEQLQRALASVSNPEWIARDYQEAAKAIAASDYARAIALLRSIIDDGQDRPVQIKSRQLLQDLEQQATGRLARAKQFVDRGQTTEAIETITELVRLFTGTQAATEGGQMLTALANNTETKTKQRARRARELLAQAREDYRSQQYLWCLDRCELLGSGYLDMPEGVEALQLATEIKSNPEWMRQACDSLGDRLGTLYLSLAETWLKKGQPQQARECLEHVIQVLPGTRHAEAAQLRLAQIQGQPPTRTVEFKKP